MANANYDDLDSLLDDLVDAAIKADMYERDYWAQEGAQVFHNYALYKEVHRGNPGANDMGDDEDDHTDYEAEVFNWWPAKIDEVFAVWRTDSIPDPADFDTDIKSIADSTNPIAMPSQLIPAAYMKTLTFHKAQMPDTGVGDSLVYLKRHMDDLEGGWVTGFYDNYVSVVPWVIGNQKAILDVLIAALEGEQDLWKRSRQFIADLVVAATQWFLSLVKESHAWDLVISLAGTMYDAVTGLPDLIKDPKGALDDPIGTLGTLTGLSGAPGSFLDELEKSEPVDLAAQGMPESVDSALNRLAQSLEYTLCDAIEAEENKIKSALTTAVSAMSAHPDTFEMGSGHLEAVADVDDVMFRKQKLERISVDGVILNLRHAGNDLAKVVDGFQTSVFPWIRPAGIGIGGEGPYPQLLQLENAVNAAIHHTSANLQAAATAVKQAADLMYDTDGVTSGDVRRVNDKLDQVQDRLRDDPGPTPNVQAPHTNPGGEVYVNTPDCDPATPDDPDAPPLLGGDDTSDEPFVNGNGPLAPTS